MYAMWCVVDVLVWCIWCIIGVCGVVCVEWCVWSVCGVVIKIAMECAGYCEGHCGV